MMTVAKIRHARYRHSPAAHRDMLRLFRAGDTIAEWHAGPTVNYPYFHQRLLRPISIVPKAQRPARTLRGQRATRIAQRLQEERSERMQLLARYAEQNALTAQLETPGQYAVRDPKQPGIVQLATVFTCTCPSFGIWRRCEHQSLVQRAEGLI